MNLHILIVEDEPAIAETLVYACKEANMQATHCQFGHTALDVLKSQTIDFIVLDVGLPDITGFELCKQIRSFSQTPVLFLTARNHEVDRIVGLEIGADDYVIKPFSPREVVARIKVILRRFEAGHATPRENLAVQNSVFLLDETAQSIQYHGQLLKLTRYEFLLLKTLILKPKRIFSRSQLMDLVWQNAEETMERTVDAHVKTLRAKLREIDATDIISTHRGMGYSLKA